MEKILKIIKSLSKKQLILGALGIVMVGGIVYSYTKSPELTVVKAERGNIEEEVLVTGKTKPAEDVDLGFERGGKIVRVNGKIGAHVFKGNTLVVIDQSSLLADLRKAEANLNEELVKLDTTKETSNLKYEDAYNALYNELHDAYNSADNAIRNNADRFFTSPRSSSIKFNITFVDGPTTYYFNIPDRDAEDLVNERRGLEDMLDDWNASLVLLKNGDNLDSFYKDAENNLSRVRSFLTDLASAINSLTTDDFSQQATLQGYRTSVAEARTEIASALTNLLSANTNLNNAPTITESGTSKNFNDVRAGEARVESLKANISSIQADLGKTILKSPIDGVITKADAKLGEIVSSGESLVSVISDKKFDIEANVSEVNIGKVKIGNPVSITFDAYPGNTYEGVVSYIDPGETVIDGVPTYKVTVSFEGEVSNDVRSGLTANLKIKTATKENVIKIPRYAVNKKGDISIVKVQVGDRGEEREIVTGLVGKDGTFEVISGLNEGESVIAEIKL